METESTTTAALTEKWMGGPRFSDREWSILIWTPRMTGALSILCSSLIVYMIFRDRRAKGGTFPYPSRYRLILGMSAVDLLNSFALGLSTAPIPHGTRDVPGAIGTTASCNFQGFLVQLGLAVPMYSLVLSLYFLLKIRFGVRRDRMGSRYEPWMHAAAWLYPLGTAIAGLPLGLYNSNGLICWIEAHPYKCLKRSWVDCTRGEDSEFYQIVFSLSIAVVAFVGIVTNMMLIIWTVQRRESGWGWNIFRFRQGQGGTSEIVEGGADRGSSSHVTESGAPRASGSATVPVGSHTRETAAQALLYIWAFLITYTWTVGVVMAEQSNIMVPFPWHATMQAFLPLQGFWNFLAFLRPRYVFARERLPPESRRGEVFLLALRGDSGGEAIVEAAVARHNPGMVRRRHDGSTREDGGGAEEPRQRQHQDLAVVRAFARVQSLLQGQGLGWSSLWTSSKLSEGTASSAYAEQRTAKDEGGACGVGELSVIRVASREESGGSTSHGEVPFRDDT